MFRWMFDGLSSNGANFDIIGMSLYPSTNNWQTLDGECLSNMSDDGIAVWETCYESAKSVWMSVRPPPAGLLLQTSSVKLIPYRTVWDLECFTGNSEKDYNLAGLYAGERLITLENGYSLHFMVSPINNPSWLYFLIIFCMSTFNARLLTCIGLLGVFSLTNCPAPKFVSQTNKF